MKLKAILIAMIILLMSCEEQSALPVEGNVTLKKKRFNATSVTKVYNEHQPITNLTTKVYLGATTIDGLKIYARPFFKFEQNLNSNNLTGVSTTKYIKNNGELLFEDSEFSIALDIDSVGNDLWNSSFSSQVSLKMSAIEFGGDTLFDKGQAWDDYRFQEIPNLKNSYKDYDEQMIRKISEADISSGDALIDSAVVFDISKNNMNHLYDLYWEENIAEIKASEDTQVVRLSGFFLDLDDFSGEKGMVTFDVNSFPTLTLNYSDSDSVGVIDSDVISASSAFTWFTYEQITDDGTIYIKSGDRESMLLDFTNSLEIDSLKDFLNDNSEIYGAALFVKNSNTSSQLINPLLFSSYTGLSIEDGINVYTDANPITKYGGLTQSGFGILKDSLSNSSIHIYDNLTNFDARYITPWQTRDRELGKLIISSSYQGSVGFSKFSPTNLENYYLEIYYIPKSEEN